MNSKSFENLANDTISEIFYYLSPVDVLQAFSTLNQRLTHLITNEHLWHIRIGDSRMSLMTFTEHSENILKSIGYRVISLRVNLMNTIGGWSLVSSLLHRRRQTFLLRRLHLIDIQPDEFDKLLGCQFIRQLHTLLVDVTPSNLLNWAKVEGSHLVKVCSRMPLLRICRLSNNYEYNNVAEVETSTLKSRTILSNFLHINQLRNLTIGIHSSHFLERLLLCLPLVENLSFGVKNQTIASDTDSPIILPTTIDTDLLQHLSRLHICCFDHISFHRIVLLLSSVFNQLCHLSLKLQADTLVSGSTTISGDVIQKLIIDRLQPMATYRLNLLLYAANDFEEKKIFNSFRRVEFVQREKPRIIIRECYDRSEDAHEHCFMLFTVPYDDTILLSRMFLNDFEKSCPTSTDATNLFPHATSLSLYGYKKTNRLRDLVKSESSISSFLPWSLISKIKINDSDTITQHTLKCLLDKANNVDELEFTDHRGILIRTMLYNKANYGTRINQQIKSLSINNETWTLHNVERFCTLLSNQFCNLKTFSFIIYDSYHIWEWKPSRMNDGENKSTKRLINLICLIVDHFQQLVYLEIGFCNMFQHDTPYFPHLVRRQLHQYPLRRLCRVRCIPEYIKIWL